MSRTPLHEERFRNLVEMSKSPAQRMIWQLDNSSAAQAARMAECPASIERARRAIESDISEILAAARSIDRNLRTVVLTIDRVTLPAAETLQALAQSAARAIQPLHGHFVEAERRWSSSIAQRMATLTAPWAMQDNLGVSIAGFSRIARLHDVATGATPFSPQNSQSLRGRVGATGSV